MLRSLIRHALRQEEGATAVEYAVMLSLIIIVALAAIKTLGTTNANSWSMIDKNLQSSGVK